MLKKVQSIVFSPEYVDVKDALSFSNVDFVLTSTKVLYLSLSNVIRHNWLGDNIYKLSASVS